ncbi:MAG: DUF4230 domain-containing protein [Pseudomonadota bacterium]
MAVLAIVAIVGIYAWCQKLERDKAEKELGLAASRVISEVFRREYSLRVATLTGDVVAKGTDPGYLGWLKSTMTLKYPYSVSYNVDVSRIGRADYTWDEASRTLSIKIPDVRPDKPNIDASKAVLTDTTGIWISRTSAFNIAKQAAGRASLSVHETALKENHLQAARLSAREFMENFLAQPLRVAKLGQVNVAVRFPWEGVGAGVPVRWDESRTVGQVYGTRR